MVFFKHTANKILNNLFLTGLGLFFLAILVVQVSKLVIPDSLRQTESTDLVNYYLPVAENIQAGYGLLTYDGSPAVLYPPGYPVMIAGIIFVAESTGLSAGMWVNGFTVVCFGLSVVLVFLISRTIWPPALAVVPAILWCCYPFAVWLAQQPNVEMPFLALSLSGFLFWWKGLRRNGRRGLFFFAGGILIGLAMLVRPIGLFLGVILGGLILMGANHAKILSRAGFLLLFLSGSLLTVLPWEIWAYNQTGYVIPLGSKGVHSILDGLTFAVNSKGYRAEFQVNEGVKTVMEDIYWQAGQINTFPEVVELLGVEIDRHPAGVVQLFLLKGLRSWFGTDSGRGEGLILGVQIVYFLLIWVSLILGCVKKTNRFLVITVGSLVLYFWLMTVLVLSILRYMVPVFAFAFLLTPELMLWIQKIIRRPGIPEAAKGFLSSFTRRRPAGS
jgi:hypothetical protein